MVYYMFYDGTVIILHVILQANLQINISDPQRKSIAEHMANSGCNTPLVPNRLLFKKVTDDVLLISM